MSGGTDFYAGDRALSKRIDAWVAASQFNAWQIHTRYKRWPQVIYNGVETDKFAPGVRDESLHTRLCIAADTTLFAFAGRLVGWKGLTVALKALAEAPMREANAKLLVVGDGPQKPELRQLAQSLGVSERVVFHDPVPHEQLPALYGAVDVGVFPSIGDEAFGITIAEAMSCGKPVIASHIGGIPEVVGNEETCGLLVPPGIPPRSHRLCAGWPMTLPCGHVSAPPRGRASNGFTPGICRRSACSQRWESVDEHRRRGAPPPAPRVTFLSGKVTKAILPRKARRLTPVPRVSVGLRRCAYGISLSRMRTCAIPRAPFQAQLRPFPDARSPTGRENQLSQNLGVLGPRMVRPSTAGLWPSIRRTARGIAQVALRYRKCRRATIEPKPRM